jgi:DNA-binding NtrC family response regulator
MTPTLLIVDDEKTTREGLRAALEQHYDVYLAEDAKAAMELLEKDHFDVLLTDFRLPTEDGMKLIARAKSLSKPPICILMTAYGSEELAVEAMKRGADDYIAKGRLQIDELEMRIANALRRQKLEVENVSLHQQLDAKFGLQNLVGESPAMKEVFEVVRQVAPTRATVLLLGESGTGKEMVARTLHKLSQRRQGPFIAINCAALPETLIESELFGHEKGSFTGASERRAGCFELAQHGTLLLDEIGEMPLPTQAKLLRILEDSKVRRLGGKTEFEVDVRLVAATNKVPDEAIRGGHLREDLYYRLNVFHIHLPPLRERKEDVAPISDALIDALNRKHECRVTGIASDVLDAFDRYSWPGNVRELRNVLERAVILAGEGTLELKHVPAFLQGRATMAAAAGASASAVPDDPESVRFSIGTTVEDAEKGLILRTLEHTHNNKTRAAEILGISLKTLHNKLKEYGG